MPTNPYESPQPSLTPHAPQATPPRKPLRWWQQIIRAVLFFFAAIYGISAAWATVCGAIVLWSGADFRGQSGNDYFLRLMTGLLIGGILFGIGNGIGKPRFP